MAPRPLPARAHRAWLTLSGCALLGCSSAAVTPPATPSAADDSTAAAPEASESAAAPQQEQAQPSTPEAAARELPTDCKRVGELCLPPRDFVRRLCQGAFTGAAFHLFEKSTPFSRGYVRAREVRSVNALGGPASDANLEFGEEVLILTRTGEAGPNQMQVSGMGGYDVLRWDGTCANLADGELSLRAPIPPRHAPIDWRYIDSNIQEALLLDEGIKGARKNQRQHCHGVSLGSRSAKCVEADSRLNDRIVLAVRGGLALPLPDNIP
jgi:hypothetical protein